MVPFECKICPLQHFSHRRIFLQGGASHLKDEKNTVLKKVVRTFIKTGRGGGQRPFINFIKKQTFWKRVWSLTVKGQVEQNENGVKN